MRIIEQRSGKRVYDFTKPATEERPPTDERHEEQRVIDAAMAIMPEQLVASQLPKARDTIAHAIEILDLQVAAIRHDLGRRWLHRQCSMVGKGNSRATDQRQKPGAIANQTRRGSSPYSNREQAQVGRRT